MTLLPKFALPCGSLDERMLRGDGERLEGRGSLVGGDCVLASRLEGLLSGEEGGRQLVDPGADSLMLDADAAVKAFLGVSEDDKVGTIGECLIDLLVLLVEVGDNHDGIL